VKVADLGGYLKKIKNERTNILQTAFWSEFIDGILEYRRKASKNCEIHEDVRIYQGEIKAYDRVFTLPEKIISIVEEKDKKRATNR